MTVIDLNADVGEGCADDDALLEVVTTANVAAGGHAGGGETLIDTVTRCSAEQVAVGAHPAYPDRENFGRLSRWHEYDAVDLTAILREQILDVAHACTASGIQLTHVKAHGALYHDVAGNHAVADIFVTAVVDVSKDLGYGLYVTGSPTSQLSSVALAHDISFVAEAFIDRLYYPDGTLVPRSHPDAVHRDPQAAIDQAASIVLNQRVTASDGSTIGLHAQTLCVHGDSPGAVQMARAVRQLLSDNNVTITAIAGAAR